MTPNDIEVLIHCYVCADQHPRAHAPAVQDALETLYRNGLIIPTAGAGTYETTAKGAAHVKQICELPLPRKSTVWVGYNGEITGVEP